MDLFDNGDLEEFLLLVQNFKMTLKALEMLADITKIQYLCTILRGKAPHQFDNFCAHVGSIITTRLKHIILGLGTYFPPVNALSKKKRYLSFLYLFWNGLRDYISCSIVSGGNPTQNIGYKSIRICPYYLGLCATFPVLKLWLWSPLSPLRGSPGFLDHQGKFPAHNISLLLLPPLCPFVV